MLRRNILADFQGLRLGETTSFEHTIGWVHDSYGGSVLRPEIRLDGTSGAKGIGHDTSVRC